MIPSYDLYPYSPSRVSFGLILPIGLLFILFEPFTCPEDYVPDSQLRAEVSAVVTVMEIVEIVISAQRQDLNRGPAEHVPTMPIVGVVDSKDNPAHSGRNVDWAQEHPNDCHVNFGWYST